ncbi:MAG: DUF4198 domain-containing protein [Gammaproteobacteria bacterium]
MRFRKAAGDGCCGGHPIRIHAGRRTRATSLRLILFLTFHLPVAGAHDFWVEPDRFRVDVGESVALRLYQGQQLRGETLPYITDWFSRFQHIDSAGLHPVESEMGNDPAATLRIGRGGNHWVIYQSTRDFVKLEAEKFHRYLREEGLEAVIEARRAAGEADQPAREYYSRCAKSLITAPGRGDAPSVDFGMTLELIPEADPARLRPGERLPLRVRYLERYLENVLVTAFRRSAPEARVTARSDPKGRVELPFDAPGLWLVKAVHMVRPQERDRADWESFWATLLFEIAPLGGE